ncbi:hypothetical protein F5Y02DRAFT_153999 [Annulohypoxylon stygium]|nr:hypothetical protein F5Y02DRAFT_153999 [Annulohypoxylon stygium]
MASTKPAAHVSRSLLASRGLHVGCGGPNLSHGLGRTSRIVSRFPIRASRQLSTSECGSGPWLQRPRATPQVVGGSKRGFANSSEPTEPEEPAKPAEAEEPVEPAKSAEPEELEELVKPEEPAESTELAEATEPTETVEPAEPAEQGEQVELTEPAETEPAETEPAETEPVEITEPIETTDPTELTKPEEPQETASKANPVISSITKEAIWIDFPEQSRKIFDRHWLRDSCDCSICVDTDSGQKRFGTCDVPPSPAIVEASLWKDGQGLDIVWADDFLSKGNHESHYDFSRLLPSRSPFKGNPLPGWILWDKATFERDRLTIDYDEWMAGESGFISGLHRLHTHGLLFLRNVPPSEDSVVSIAEQIGHIKETFYGRTWDVRSKPNAENVAYTNSFLGLHQDLLYTANPPRIQILHCLENTCEGGESLFSDGARVSNLFRIADNTLAEHLATRALRYEYKKNGQLYENFRTIMDRESSAVFWSPPFQSPEQPMFQNNSYQQFYRKWLKAATKFRDLLEDEQWLYQYKMQPGECVLFDNMRVLHGRRQFDTATGSRHLKGTYIAKDVYLSKLKSVAPQLLELSKHEKNRLTLQALRFQKQYKVWDKVRNVKILEQVEKELSKPKSFKVPRKFSVPLVSQSQVNKPRKGKPREKSREGQTKENSTESEEKSEVKRNGGSFRKLVPRWKPRPVFNSDTGVLD